MLFLNAVIDNGNVRHSDILNLFPEDEGVIAFDKNTDMYDLLIFLGCFSSKTQAKKNWKKTDQNIPGGWSHFTRIGSKRRELAIWNPTEP